MKLDIVGTQEAALVLNVEVGRVSRWKKDGKMPPLVADLGASPVWLRRDVERFAKAGHKWTFKPSKPLPIMGLQEVSDHLGISKRQITRLRARDAFPAPRLEKRPAGEPWTPGSGLGATPIWLRADIDAYAHQLAA
jgi:hypothetical protein